jgi:hypothetical protein
MPKGKKEFGPNQDEVDRLLERLETVDQHQALFLASLDDEYPARHAARLAYRAAAKKAGRQRELQAAQDCATSSRRRISSSSWDRGRS